MKEKSIKTVYVFNKDNSTIINKEKEIFQPFDSYSPTIMNQLKRVIKSITSKRK